jgi:CRISPR-associated protein Csm3
MSYGFLGNVVFEGEIECVTGLQIGGGQETLEIGGVDQPVVKDPVSDRPYIPGSSLKGKMRSLMEWDRGRVESDGEPHYHEGEDAVDCEVCRIFGTPAESDAETGPTRLSVRDAYPTDETIEQWKEIEGPLPYTEMKSENYINRVTSEANPRDFERVTKGSEFEYEFVYGVYDLGDGGETDIQNLSEVERAMVLLEDSSLGASGSRGYGSIRFHGDGFKVRGSDYYGDKDDEVEAESIEEVEEILTE